VRIAMISYHASPFATPGAGANGGMSVYVRNLATQLARSGHEVEIFTAADAPAGSRRIEPGLVLHSFPEEPASGGLADDELTSRLECFSERVVDVLSRPGAPVDALHANYWLSAVVAHVAKHELATPLAVTFHTLERAKLELGQQPTRLTEARVYQEQRVLGCTDLVVSSSRAEAEWLRTLYGPPPGEVVIVEPGIDPAVFAPAGRRDLARRAIGVPPEATVLLYVGRIQSLKGTALAVASWLALDDPDVHLVVVGGPSGHDGHAELQHAIALAQAAGAAERLHLVPPRPQVELGTYYRAADLTVVPSESETFGLVALESLACATPVVATRIGGLAELVAHGITGVLVDERTPEAFAEGIRTLLAAPERRLRLGRLAARRAARRTWTRTARELLNAIERLGAVEPAACVGCA